MPYSLQAHHMIILEWKMDALQELDIGTFFSTLHTALHLPGTRYGLQRLRQQTLSIGRSTDCSGRISTPSTTKMPCSCQKKSTAGMSCFTDRWKVKTQWG